MVNPDELITKSDRETWVVYDNDEKLESMKEEAREGSSSEGGAAKVLQRMFRRKSTLQKEAQSKHNNLIESKGHVYLPILIIPGIASSGLYVVESSLDNDTYKGERVWMNAAFLAKSRLQNTLLNENELEHKDKFDIVDDYLEKGADVVAGVGATATKKFPVTMGKAAKWLRIGDGVGSSDANAAARASSSAAPGVNDEDAMDDDDNSDDNIDNDNDDSADAVGFSKTEEELEIRNAWIQHIALADNMIDERPGNKIRVYDGMKGCEWLVDDTISKTQGWVWAKMIKYATETLGYEREKNIDAAPYDWRLAPSVTETRDGYLTKTMKRIEKLHDDNDNLPIILCCHSMGCKMGHYFLNFAKETKGQEWLDKYIHTYMPVGAPHGGVALSIRTGATGAGLTDIVDSLVGKNSGDGLTMYRSWSSGNWLMPRHLPPNVFPSVIVRKEGELGLTVTSKIDVGTLFQDRDKPPKELRLTIQFRNGISAHTEFHPVIVTAAVEDDDDDNNNNNSTSTSSMTVSFQETFYLAVPYLGDEDEIGELVFYLEEPGGRIHQNASEFGKQFTKATGFMRGMKKKASAFYRNVAKKWGSVLRVACNESPMIIKVSDFVSDVDGAVMVASATGKYNLQTSIAIVGMDGGGSRFDQDNTATATEAKSLADMATAKSLAADADWGAYLRRYPDLQKAFGEDHKKARKHYFEYGFKEGRDPSPGEAERLAANADWGAYLSRYDDIQEHCGDDHKKAKEHFFEYGFEEGRDPGPDEDSTGEFSAKPRNSVQLGESVGSLSLKISYCPPPTPSTEPTSTPIAITNKDTPNPPILSKRSKLNTVSCDRVEYDVWSGTDLFKNDGFVDNMFDMVETYYEGDPLGPITKSALDAPPVNCVRSIYGINVPTEVGAVYRKVPVVTVGDNLADSRYMLDKAAMFPSDAYDIQNCDDSMWAKSNLSSYKLKDGIVTETPMTLQNVPGHKEQRRVCGDGTVPYWNVVHALTWKDDVDELTVDELDGAVHRDIIADERFFALLKRYCRIVDPRANAMLMMKSNKFSEKSGINALSTLNLDRDSSSSLTK